MQRRRKSGAGTRGTSQLKGYILLQYRITNVLRPCMYLFQNLHSEPRKQYQPQRHGGYLHNSKTATASREGGHLTIFTKTDWTFGRGFYDYACRCCYDVVFLRVSKRCSFHLGGYETHFTDEIYERDDNMRDTLLTAAMPVLFLQADWADWEILVRPVHVDMGNVGARKAP